MAAVVHIDPFMNSTGPALHTLVGDDDSDLTHSPNRSRHGSISQCARTQRTGRPGSRRYQRFLNALFLNAAVTPEQLLELDDDKLQELEEEFLLRPEYNSNLSELFKNSANMQAWEPFVDVTEEQQQALLDEILPHSDDEVEWESLTAEAKAKESFKGIDKKTRELLLKPRNLPLIEDLEAHLLAHFIAPDVAPAPKESVFFKTMLAPKKTVSAASNADELFSGRPSSTMSEESLGNLCLLFKSSHDRRLCHGVCKYYALVSTSEDSKQKRVTVITKEKYTSYTAPPPSLAKYLQDSFFNHAE